jgi:hypothetical protein
MRNQTNTAPVTRFIIARQRHISYDEFVAASENRPAPAKPSNWSDQLWDDMECGRISYRRAAEQVQIGANS